MLSVTDSGESPVETVSPIISHQNHDVTNIIVATFLNVRKSAILYKSVVKTSVSMRYRQCLRSDFGFGFHLLKKNQKKGLPIS